MEVSDTIIIESNQRTATQMEFQASEGAVVGGGGMPPDRNNEWTSFIENGVMLEPGDQITVEASTINLLGDPNATLEFDGGQTSRARKPLRDNKATLETAYYMTNSHTFNFPLPLHRIRTNWNTQQAQMGAPMMWSWERFAGACPVAAVEGCVLNNTKSTQPFPSAPDPNGGFIPKAGAATMYPPSAPPATVLPDYPQDQVNSYYITGGQGPYYEDGQVSPSLLGVDAGFAGSAPLTNGCYETHKPNGMRLYLHKPLPDDIGNFASFWHGADPAEYPAHSDNYTDLLLKKNISLSVDEGFLTPSSVGEYLTSQMNKKLTPDEIDFTPCYFGMARNMTGAHEMDGNFGSKEILAPSLIKFPHIDVATASYLPIPTVGGRLLDNFFKGKWTGSIGQYHVDSDGESSNPWQYCNQTEADQIMFGDMLDGDIKKTNAAIILQNSFVQNSHSQEALPNVFRAHGTDDQTFVALDVGPTIRGNNLKVPPPAPAPAYQELNLYGQNIVVCEDLPRIKGLNLKDNTFWINNSGEREARWSNYPAGQVGGPLGNNGYSFPISPGVYKDIFSRHTTTVNSGGIPAAPARAAPYAGCPQVDGWSTIPPYAFDMTRMDVLKLEPYDLIPTNIVATTGGLSQLFKAFGASEYVQSGRTSRPASETVILSKSGSSSQELNVVRTYCTRFQIGRSDDQNSTTEGLYGSNQINIVAPIIVNFWENPWVALGDHPAGGQQALLLNNYYIPGGQNWDFTPDWAKQDATSASGVAYPGAWCNETSGLQFGANTWGGMGDYDAAGSQPWGKGTFDLPEQGRYQEVTPRLISRNWWNDTILNNSRYPPYSIRDVITSESEPWLGDPKLNLAEDNKKGDEVKYELELQTRWTPFLDPQSPDFKCRLMGWDLTEAASHYRYTNTKGEYFDVKRLQWEFLQATAFDPTPTERFGAGITSDLQNLNKYGIGIVVVFLKPDCAVATSPLYRGACIDPNALLNGLFDIPYVAFVNLTMCDGLDENLGPKSKKIPCPLWGEFFAPSLCQYDNKWSKVITTQKRPELDDKFIDILQLGQTNQEDAGAASAQYNAMLPALGGMGDCNLASRIVGSYNSQQSIRVFATLASATSTDDQSLAYITNMGNYHMSSYIPYVHIGADAPSINFDDNYSRFTIGSLSCALRDGNGVYPAGIEIGSQFIGPWWSAEPYASTNTSAARIIPAKNNAEDFSQEIISVNGNKSAISQYVGFRQYQMMMGWNPAGGITQNVLNLYDWNCGIFGTIEGYRPPGAPNTIVPPNFPVGIYMYPARSFNNVRSSSDILPFESAQSGIGIVGVIVPYRDWDAPGDVQPSPYDTLLELENGGYKKLSPWFPNYTENTLIDKMGLAIEQLIPFCGNQNNIYNRDYYTSYVGYDKNMVDKSEYLCEPFTTNAYISGSLTLGMTTNDLNFPMNDLGVMRPKVPVKTNAETDVLVSVKLPSKLSYGYLVVYSDILEQQSKYYGSNYVTSIPAIGYITRNYNSSDFFYSFANSWNYIVDKKRSLNSFTIDIRLPNGRKPKLDGNSTIIFKVIKQKFIGIKELPKQIKAPPTKEETEEDYNDDYFV